jgi:hypothetical protein
MHARHWACYRTVVLPQGAAVSAVDGVQVGLLGLRHTVAELGSGAHSHFMSRPATGLVSVVFDQRGDIYSASKTFTSMAFGIAQDGACWS